MSLESLLLNALRCHLVFAGSLQQAGVGERREPHRAGLRPHCAPLFLARLLRASRGWKEREKEHLADLLRCLGV